MIRKLLLAGAILAGLSLPARADFAFTVGSGAMAFSFTASTGGTSLCAASVTHCFAHVQITSAGVETGTVGHPTVVTVANSNTNLATNADAIAAVAAGAAGAGSPVNSANYVFNGTTWDRMPGTTTGVKVRQNDGTNSQQIDPCQSETKLYLPISQATLTQLFTGTSAKKTYVCHILVVTAAAENVSLVAGTGTVCATNMVAMIGSVTVANGANLSANGGFSIGNGGYSVAASTVAQDNVCLIQSGSVRVAGVITYVAR